MQRIVTLAAAAAALALALAVAGCKDEAPQSGLEMFVARTAELEGQALDDTLRTLSAGDTPYAGFASYLLGNKYYRRAGETADMSGWGDGTVNTLLDSAEVFFNLAIAQDSTLIEAMVNLGSLWDDRSQQIGSREERDRRLAEAERFYRLALEVRPDDEKARCNLGGLYLRQKQRQKALDEFMHVLDNDPRSALAHYNLAIMFAEDKIYREALREWELAVKYDREGDIGSRSAENIRIVQDLMNAPDPDLGR